MEGCLPQGVPLPLWMVSILNSRRTVLSWVCPWRDFPPELKADCLELGFAPALLDALCKQSHSRRTVLRLELKTDCLEPWFAPVLLDALCKQLNSRRTVLRLELKTDCLEFGFAFGGISLLSSRRIVLSLLLPLSCLVLCPSIVGLIGGEVNVCLLSCG